jgi:hypothetical protein
MNDEFPMTNDEGMSSDEAQELWHAGTFSAFVLSHSFVILHSSFVI